MNEVRAAGVRVRRQDKADARTARGLPARRRRPAPFPSGQLRDRWPSGSKHRPARPVTAHLLGAGQAPLMLAQRSRVPVGLRNFHPVTFREVPATTGWRKPPVTAAVTDVDLVPGVPAVVSPASTVEPDAAPVVEPTVAVEPEPVVAVEPEPVVAAEPEPFATEPEPVVAVEPEPVVAAEPEPVVAVEPEPVATEPEPVAEAEPVTATAAPAAPIETVAPVAPTEAAAPTEATAPVEHPGRHDDGYDARLARSSRVLDATREVMLSGHDPATAVSADTALTEAWDDPEPTRRRPSGRLLVVAAGVVLLVAAGTTAGVVATRGSDTPRPAVAASSAAATAIPDRLPAWIRTNFGATTVVYTTDAALTTAVAATGLTVRTVSGLDAVPALGVVVTRLGAGDTPSADVESVSATRSVVPVAAFTTGGAAYVVGQGVEKSAAQVEADRDSSTSTAQAAATGLLSNAAVTVSAEARPVLAGGTLDLRAAATLATVASSQSVTIVSAPQDDAEAALGVPVRTLVVTVADRAALQAAVDNARYPYAPTVSTPTTGDAADTVQLTWSVLSDPALTVT